MSEQVDREQALQRAIAKYAALPQDDDREASLAELRKEAGTASRFYRGGRGRWARFVNWALDAEYVAVGPPPIAWMAVAGGLIAVTVMWVLA